MKLLVSSKLGLGLAVVTVLAAGTALEWAGRSEVFSAPVTPGVESSVDPATESEDLGLGDRSRLPMAGSAGLTAPPSPSLAFLEDYFGSEAAAVRSALEAKGVDLATTPAPVSEQAFQNMLPGWLVFKEPERVAWTEQLLLWPDELDSDWLQQRLGLIVVLSEAELEAVEALADLYRPDIEVAIGRYLDSLEMAMYDEYARGGIQSSPFLAWPEGATDGPPAFFSMVRAGQGWVAQIQLYPENHPSAHVARSEIAVEIAKRDADLRQTLFVLQQGPDVNR